MEIWPHSDACDSVLGSGSTNRISNKLPGVADAAQSVDHNLNTCYKSQARGRQLGEGAEG